MLNLCRSNSIPMVYLRYTYAILILHLPQTAVIDIQQDYTYSGHLLRKQEMVLL
jgi:hypothetical protein